MNRKLVLLAGVFLLLAVLAFAPQTPMRQGYYWTLPLGNDAGVGVTYSEGPLLNWAFSTSDTLF
jgi:hypothetical protein